MGVLADVPDFDLLAASLRADARDTATFLEVLAGKLEEALPGAVSVRRSGGLFHRERSVHELTVTLGEWRLRLAARPGGVPRAEREHLVRGVSLKSDDVDLDVWIDALAQALSAHARSGSTAAASLQRFLG